MADKVQKIREEVARIQLYTQSEVLKQILDYIDSMQEDPIKIDRQVSKIADEFAEREYETDGYERQWLSKGYYHGYMDANKDKLKEPVSEELWEAAQIYYEELQKEKFEGSDVIDAFKAGAKWQKEQFEKNRLKHCDSITNEQAELEQGFIDQHLDKYQRMPTFLDAVEYGMRLQKEQMMKDAVDGWVFRDIKEGKLRISDNKECWNGIRIPEKSIEKSYLFCTTDDAIKVKLVIVKED